MGSYLIKCYTSKDFKLGTETMNTYSNNQWGHFLIDLQLNSGFLSVFSGVAVPVLAGASLGGVGSVGVVLLVLGLSSFT